MKTNITFYVEPKFIQVFKEKAKELGLTYSDLFRASVIILEEIKELDIDLREYKK